MCMSWSILYQTVGCAHSKLAEDYNLIPSTLIRRAFASVMAAWIDVSCTTHIQHEKLADDILLQQIEQASHTIAHPSYFCKASP